LQKRSGDSVLDRQLLRECARHQRPGVSSFLASIAVLASVAPLLGLLGTVVGMTQTFDVIAVFGTGNAKALASGISIALITTQSGLLIAIPGLLMSAALGRQASRLEMRLDEVTTVLERYV
jgi:biopolymer transport protein ExbB